MAREFRNSDLQVWEAFATTGEHGFSDQSRIGFRCRTDPGARPMWIGIDGDKSDAEARVQTLSDGELETLLEKALELV